jgi:hypothetical protein
MEREMSKPIEAKPTYPFIAANTRIANAHQLQLAMTAVENCSIEKTKVKLAMAFLPQVKAQWGDKFVQEADAYKRLYPLFYRLLTEKTDKA